MKKSLIVFLLVLLPFLKLEAVAGDSYEITGYKMPGIQVIPIKDTKSNRQYELLVKLPENYAENKDKKYPVIYFTDAVWHIELLSSITFFMMEDVILVGVSWQKDIGEDLIKEEGAHVSRYRDYSFKKSSNAERQAKYEFGQASNHLAFIRNDVFKYVETNYRTEPDNRTYFGFSMGGLFGAYALLTQPDSFKNYLLGSPSLWQLSALESKADANVKNMNANVFVSYGSLEEKLRPHIEDFVRLMKKRNDKSLKLKQVVIESAGHSDSSPMMSVRSVKWLSSLQPKGDK
ncbi:alpha/beta hydrolase [Aliikangiella coralliicola]|nr:alpha/beta hydrolase-fold protein [Aliikangiella coralliicola]